MRLVFRPSFFRLYTDGTWRLKFFSLTPSIPGIAATRGYCALTGFGIPPLLDGILSLMNLDSYVDAPVMMMAPVPGDELDASVEAALSGPDDRHWPKTPPSSASSASLSMSAAKKAFAIVDDGRDG